MTTNKPTTVYDVTGGHEPQDRRLSAEHDPRYIDERGKGDPGDFRYIESKLARTVTMEGANRRHVWVCPRAFTGTDSLSRANRNTWAEDFKDSEGFAWVAGTDEIYIRAIVTVPAIVEALEHLADYPVMSDDELSHVEMEDESEAWDSYACRDFARALDSAFGLEPGTVKNPGKDDVLFSYFHMCAERGNVNGGPGVIHEETGPCFLVDDVAESANMAEALALGLLTVTDSLAELADVDGQEARDEARRLRRAEKVGQALKTFANMIGMELSDMTVDAGDLSAGLSAECLGNVALRSFTVTLRRFEWNAQCQKHVATVILDPYGGFSPASCPPVAHVNGARVEWSDDIRKAVRVALGLTAVEYKAGDRA